MNSSIPPTAALVLRQRMTLWRGPQCRRQRDDRLGRPVRNDCRHPYANNPAADALELADPVAFAEALAYGGPAPKLFEGGRSDVPAQTRSGIEGYWMSWLPAAVRHHAANLPTKDDVMDLFERVAGDPGARIDHPGLAAAEARLNTWSTSARTDKAAAAAAAQTKPRPARPTRQGAMATMTSHTPDELLAMGRRGEFLPPRSRATVAGRSV